MPLLDIMPFEIVAFFGFLIVHSWMTRVSSNRFKTVNRIIICGPISPSMFHLESDSTTGKSCLTSRLYACIAAQPVIAANSAVAAVAAAVIQSLNPLPLAPFDKSACFA